MTKTAALRVVLGDQLTPGLSALEGLDPARDRVLMMEVMAECTYVPHHPQKIILILSAMRHFARALAARGVAVEYMRLDDTANTQSFAGEVARAVARHRPERACRWKFVLIIASSATCSAFAPGPRGASNTGWSFSIATCAAKQGF
jgi:deoxyribodipyrimidine photolyase-like uncharacterized protein